MRIKLSCLVAGLALVMAFLLPSGAMAADLQSLRGSDVATVDKTPDMNKQMVDQESFPRSFKQQPPLIPHKIEKYNVTLKDNGCMKCHSKESYKKEAAPKVGDTHFVDPASGKILESLSGKRYFCTQCHVPQMDAKQLVENTFKN